MRAIALLTLALTAACGSGTEPETETPNVVVYAQADLTTTDDAVLINGAPRQRFGDNPRGMFTQHSIRYENGGPFEPHNDKRLQENWYMDVARRVVTREHGDTTFSRYLDFGDVALGGIPANTVKIDTLMVYDVGEGEVRAVETFILKRILFYGMTTKADGSTVTFEHAAFYDGLHPGGGDVELTASGSDEISPLSTDIPLRPGARIESLVSGESLDFERERPVVRTDQPMVVGFDRELDPEKTVIHITYLDTPPADQELQRRASAVFTLTGRSGRVVIPPSALRAIAAEVPDVDGPFLFRMYEHLPTDDVMAIERLDTGETESLSGLQTNVLDLYFRIQ